MSKSLPPEWGTAVAFDRGTGRIAVSLAGRSQHDRSAEIELAWEQRYRTSNAFAVRK